ncbi:MAG: hypothetical protein ABI183_21285 [Polyangiaceae bacterium]
MSVQTQVSLRTWLLGSAFFGSAILLACGGDAPPAKIPDQRPPPVISVPQLVDAGASTADQAPPTPALTPPTTLATRQGTITSIVADGQWLYWLTDDGDVKRVHTAGGPASAVTSLGPTSDDLLCVQAGTVYAATTDPKSKATKILRANADLSNKPDVIGTATGALMSLTADKSRLVWSVFDKKKLTFFVLENGQKTARKLPAFEATTPGQHVILGATTATFFDAGAVKSIALANGKVTPVITLAEGQLVTEIVIAGDHVLAAYWDVDKTDPNKKTTNILSAPLAGGASTAVLSNGQHNVFDMVADGSNIYWADNDATAKADTASGRVMRLPITTSTPGNTPTLIADHQMFPDAIALDDDSVYWANENLSSASLDSEVMKLAK